MSVLIKGMEMPYTCLSCDFRKCAAGVGDYCTLTKKKQFRFKSRPSSCPLVPVPPHGRLIDADAFAAEMIKWQKSAEKRLREAKDHETAIRADAVLTTLCEMKLLFYAAPIIIPAEESET